MSTLLNKYYTGTYDPNLASEIETARPVVKLDTPVYHQTQATKVIWEYPWPYTQMIMAQDGKVKPEQFQGRERPSDGFIKTIVRKQHEEMRKRDREDRQKPLVDSQKIDRLMKQQAMMKFMNDNRNRNVRYEASLLSPEDRERYLEENNNRDRFYGIQALDNPATKRYMQFQQDMGRYFQNVNLSLSQIVANTTPLPGGPPPAGGGGGGGGGPPATPGAPPGGSGAEPCPPVGGAAPPVGGVGGFPPPPPPPPPPGPGGAPLGTPSGVLAFGDTDPFAGLPLMAEPFSDALEMYKDKTMATPTPEPSSSGLLPPAPPGMPESPPGPMGDEGDAAKEEASASATIALDEARSGPSVNLAVNARAAVAATVVDRAVDAAATDIAEDYEEDAVSDAGTIVMVSDADIKAYGDHPAVLYHPDLDKKGNQRFFNYSSSKYIIVGGPRHKTLIKQGFNRFAWVPDLPQASSSDVKGKGKARAK